MNKKIISSFSFAVIFAIIFTSISSAAAVSTGETINIKATDDESDVISFGEAGGYLTGNLHTTKKLYAIGNSAFQPVMDLPQRTATIFTIALKVKKPKLSVIIIY